MINTREVSIEEVFAGYETTEYECGRNGEKITAKTALVRFEPLIIKLAGQYRGGGADFEDLLQIGRLSLLKILPKIAGKEYFDNLLKNRLTRCIAYYAEQRRAEKGNMYGRDVALADAEDVCISAAEGDWAERENALFEKVKPLLSAEELELVNKLYAGRTKRDISLDSDVAHMTINRRVHAIQKKLESIKPWLTAMAELNCIDIPE